MAELVSFYDIKIIYACGRAALSIIFSIFAVINTQEPLLLMLKNDKKLLDAITEAIQEKKGSDIVKDRSADPALIYMSSKLDISDQVLHKLGAK